MLNEIEINSEKDKALAQTIIDLFLNNKSYDEIAAITNQNVEFVKLLLDYKKMIVSNFDDHIWDLITTRKREIKKMEKEEAKEVEYEQTMSNILYYMLNSLYNTDEIAEMVFTTNTKVIKMLGDTDYIEQKYGKQMIESLKKSIDIRKKHIKNVKKNFVIVKAPEYRSIIDPDIIKVTRYQHSLIEKVVLFFEYNGDTQAMAMNSKYLAHEIISSLHDSCLKDILLESVYEQLQVLLEVDSVLTQNRLVERKSLIKDVILAIYAVGGDVDILTQMLGYPIGVIERILNHSFTPMVCREIGIDITSIQLKKNEDNPKEKIK